MRNLAEMDPEGRSPTTVSSSLSPSKILAIDGDIPGALVIARPLVDEAGLTGDIASTGTPLPTCVHPAPDYDLDAALETLMPVRAAAAQAGEDFVVAEIDIEICDVLEGAHGTKS